MKRILIVFLVTILIGCDLNPPKERKEILGIWISYIELAQLLSNANEQEFQKRVDEMFINIKEYGLNTVYVHAVAFTDAFYDSMIYPSSHFIDGLVGSELAYDPFSIMIDAAKKYEIRFEAWINPLRSYRRETLENLDSQYILGEWFADLNKKEYLKEVDNRYYLNPAYPEVRNLIVEVVAEILNKYDVAGIHLDDYFYPEKLTADFDLEIFKEKGQGLTLSEYRRANINQLVKEIYQFIKKYDNNITLSISPSGNIQYNMETIYADVETWLSQAGYVDYIVPQIYWGFEHRSAPFMKIIQNWSDLIKVDNIDLIIGLGAYRLNQDEAGPEWKNLDILARKLIYASDINHYNGIVIFSYQSLFWTNDPIVIQQVEQLRDELRKR